MKEGTENKIKFKRLQRRLGLSLWQCTGLLESIWRITAQNTPRGDLGALSNIDIASAIEWTGDADELIAALSDGWLDPCPNHRLVVHDWADHCPNYIKGNLAKHNKTFVSNPAKQQKTGGDQAADPPKKAATEPSRALPSQTMPCRAEPTDDGHGTDGDEILISEEEWQELRVECNRLKKLIPIGVGGRPRDDCELIIKAVILRHRSAIPESIYAGALDHVKQERARKQVPKPGGLFLKALKLRCDDKGLSIRTLLGRVKIPPWLEPTIQELSRAPPGGVAS